MTRFSRWNVKTRPQGGGNDAVVDSLSVERAGGKHDQTASANEIAGQFRVKFVYYGGGAIVALISCYIFQCPR